MDVESRRIVFPRQQLAQVETFTLKTSLDPDAVLVRNCWTLISVGTELATYTNQRDLGGRSDNPYPIYPGYAAGGVVEKVGTAVSDYQPGDRVLSFSNHASHAIINPSKSLCIKIPDNVLLEHAPFARMALICLATLSCAEINAGEWMGVIGLGVIGNLGAQFGRLAGYNIASFGRSTLRSEIARQCGIDVLSANEPEEAAREMRRFSGGEGCRLVLETSGTAPGTLKAIALAEKGGTVSLVGVPWMIEPQISISEVLQPVFSNYLHIQGGWEWGLPLYDKDSNRSLQMLPHRHSIEKNARYALAEIGSQRIKVSPMITHHIQPDESQEAYQVLLESNSKAMGILIDWRNGSMNSR